MLRQRGARREPPPDTARRLPARYRPAYALDGGGDPEELAFGGLLHRYRTGGNVDGLPPGEGMFLACSFWLVSVLALQGEIVEAHELFNGLLDLSNDLGLLAEQYDPTSHTQLGNFPQALTHLALIDAALLLDRQTERPRADSSKSRRRQRQARWRQAVRG